MPIHAKDLEKRLLQDPRLRSASVWQHDAGLMVAEVALTDGLGDVSLIELLGNERQEVPIALAIAGSARFLDAEAARRRAQVGTPYEAGHTPLEQHIISLSQDLLQWEPIGRRDNFFDLGGDSLTAAMLVERLSEDLDQDIAFHEILNAPVLYEFALRLSDLAQLP